MEMITLGGRPTNVLSTPPSITNVYVAVRLDTGEDGYVLLSELFALLEKESKSRLQKSDKKEQ